jgi:hypothetical protein
MPPPASTLVTGASHGVGCPENSRWPRMEENVSRSALAAAKSRGVNRYRVSTNPERAHSGASMRGADRSGRFQRLSISSPRTIQ